MTGHVFISYRRDDAGTYVEALGSYLTAAGIPVWYDIEIDTGRRWTDVVESQINTCVAMVVVMTPGAERSEWVSNEIDQAKLMRRPILPLLLQGNRLFTLASLHYEDVTHGQMPTAAFVTRLRALLPEPASKPADPQPQSTAPMPAAPSVPAGRRVSSSPSASAMPATQPVPLRQQSVPTTRVSNNMALSIVSLFFFWPLAIPAIVFATRVNPRMVAGDISGAQVAAARSRLWSRIALGIGSVYFLILIIVGLANAS